ncbi:MAG: MBOAT family O-acyltransferase [Bacillota bacterium]|jgi:alginate O-acetyltransferase complex protein AlgI
MLFSSTTFIFCFLPIVMFVYFIILAKAPILVKNAFLLASSLFFYAWGEPKFVLVVIASMLFNWLAGVLVNKWRDNRKLTNLIIVLILLFNGGLLFIYKYLTFTLTTISQVTGATFTIPQIVLPIGISFFTFQAISYVLDVRKGIVEVQKNPLYLMLYISLFPHSIAGPIVRYKTIAEQIKERKPRFDDLSYGISRFIVGLSKKTLIADNMAIVADKAFALGASDLSMSFAWLGALAFMFQIYFDFSGYSDMAIGLARIFGFRFDENFNYPYIAKSISGFWRRWHISLSSWMRDYIYFPLGGSRVKSHFRLIFNLLMVWMFTGIWHGANWTFLLWGIFYFVFITIEKVTGFEQKMPSIWQHVYTLIVVLFGWVLFRAADLSQAVSYIQTMLGLSGNIPIDKYTLFYLKEYGIFYIIGALASLPIIPAIRKKITNIRILNIPLTVILLSLFIFSVSFIIKGNYNPFIYFKF